MVARITLHAKKVRQIIYILKRVQDVFKVFSLAESYSVNLL